jgi:hypothetical protein
VRPAHSLQTHSQVCKRAEFSKCAIDDSGDHVVAQGPVKGNVSGSNRQVAHFHTHSIDRDLRPVNAPLATDEILLLNRKLDHQGEKQPQQQKAPEHTHRAPRLGRSAKAPRATLEI